VTPPLPEQFQQTPTRMLVVLVNLEMFDQLVDPVCQQGDLNFG
jgi:hypothetical protein